MLCMEWDSHSLEVLELAWVRQEWARRADTPMGQERALQRPLSRDVATVRLRLQETDAAARLLLREPPPPMKVREVRPALTKALKGGTLAPTELLSLAELLACARLYKAHLLARAAHYPQLAHYAHQLHPLQPLERQIHDCIDPNGEVRDSASENLARIRNDQRRLQKRITERLQQLIHAWRDWLQEPTYTLRAGRYCLPVRIEHKGKAPGIVHDTSMSGATVFVEPFELVELGNRLRELQAAEQEEIEAVLYALSRAVESHGSELEKTTEALSELDAILAAGRLALDWQASLPEVNTDGYWKLRKARHPMIPRERVVPIDFEIGRDWLCVLITGPNTGGKTVTLKTLGLLTLMTLLGLHPPADEGTQIAIPYGVFADIGDEQSLQQSLSTFSGHIRHIVRFLNEAGHHSLVLLDEIGAGTDPTEGSALARAILTSLVERGARVVATTHYGDLKALAYEHPQFQNAAMEFDADTLQPTYRLHMGIPGASHAIEIADRLGMPRTIIQRALEALGVREVDLMRMIQELERQRRLAEEAEAEWRARNQQLAQLQKQLEQERQALEEARRTAYQRAQQELEQVIRALQQEANAIFQQLRQAGRESKQTAQLREQLQHLFQQATQATQPPARTAPAEAPTQEWQVGMPVRIRSLNQRGTLAALPEGGKAQVYLGKLRTEFPLSDIEPLQEAPKPVVHPVKKPRPPAPVPLELDLHGKRVEEAQPLLEKYIDDAILAGYDSVRIMHGRGTGALRKMVHAYLSQHPQVRSFHFASPNEGGEGVTIVRFR